MRSKGTIKASPKIAKLIRRHKNVHNYGIDILLKYEKYKLEEQRIKLSTDNDK